MTLGLLPGIGFVVTGGYTKEMKGGAPGVTVFAPDGQTDDEIAFTQIASVPLTSPTYLIAHPTEPWLFAASESSPATVSSLRLAPDGSLSVLSTIRTGGDGACHIALSPDGRWVVVANYGSGSVSSFLLGSDGVLSECRDLVAFSGSGPDPERQDAAHAHQVVWDGDDILVCDLGTDLIHRLTLDEHGRFAADEPVRLPAGSGPRHCVIVDDHLVVACELNAELWVAARSSTCWDEIQRVPTSTASGPRVFPSALVADGNRMFVANRGAGSVTAFDLVDGVLGKVSEFASGGSWPRDLTLAAGRLWVANQADDVITVVSLSEVPPSTIDFEIATPSAACAVIVPPFARQSAR